MGGYEEYDRLSHALPITEYLSIEGKDKLLDRLIEIHVKPRYDIPVELEYHEAKKKIWRRKQK